MAIRRKTSALLSAIAGLAASLSAATIEVDSPVDVVADDGLCTLREAITAANTDLPQGGCPAGSGDDDVRVPPGTYLLQIGGAGEEFNATGDLDVRSNLTLEGTTPGQASVIDANRLDRALEVHSDRVILRNLVVTRGLSAGGGGISNLADLTLEDCRVVENQAADQAGEGGSGGGISNISLLRLERTEVVDNRAGDGLGDGGDGGDGGGIFSTGLRNLTILRSTITGNRAGNGSASSSLGGFGGVGGGVAVVVSSGTFEIRDSTVSDNSAGNGGDGASGGVGGLGGGIFVSPSALLGSSSRLVADRVTVSSNRAGNGGSGTGQAGGGGSGGGIASMTMGPLTNVTLTGNAAGAAGAGPAPQGGQGGGLATFTTAHRVTTTTRLNNVTLAENSADVGGGMAAVGSIAPYPRIEVANSIAAQNVGGNCAALSGGTIVSFGYNLESGVDCGFAGPGDQQNADAGLFPLADYGGPTMTRALAPDSDALDAGNPNPPGSGGDACAATDQRGVGRPQGPACDIGAFELDPGGYHTLTPCRVLDTRLPSEGPALSHLVVRSIAVAGRCEVPSNATVVAVNVTVTEPTAGGHVVLYAGGGALPATSTINFAAGQTRANNAVLPLASNGSGTLDARATMAAGATVHLVLDVSGYFE